MRKALLISLLGLFILPGHWLPQASAQMDTEEGFYEDEEDDGSFSPEEFAPEPEPPEFQSELAAPDAPSTPPATDYTPSGLSKPIFDWEKHKEAKEVPHPFADKGLMRITKEREYFYRVDESGQKRAASFRIGMFNPINLENPNRQGEEYGTFEDNYDQADNPALMFDYEWQLWKSPIGKWGLRAGTGFYIAQGNGHFVNGYNTEIPREILTFWAMPNSVGAVYRMQFWDKQLVIPYGEGGGTVFGFGEFRDDGKPPKWGGALAAYFAAGVGLNLTYFDATSRILLDREYGINTVYLTAEYRGIIGLSKYDFTSDLINAGFLMEY